MNKNDYIPSPVDTSTVELSPELLAIAEELAEHVHEIWAASRYRQGWRYGAERSDERRTTPCMAPYSELPEEERDYDRATSLETIRFLVMKGFTVKK
ncbi:MAG: RyR domain-containing protein [Muribaculaceae bacterium]|nr:RyR domain-containing protein [Muribaculaceae bacterium]